LFLCNAAATSTTTIRENAVRTLYTTLFQELFSCGWGTLMMMSVWVVTFMLERNYNPFCLYAFFRLIKFYPALRSATNSLLTAPQQAPLIAAQIYAARFLMILASPPGSIHSCPPSHAELRCRICDSKRRRVVAVK
jgi:hypothetical protein